MRPDDWPALLDGYVQQARVLPFVWGSHDCVSFTCGWHRLMTGRDAYEPFRGKYDTKESAYRVMLANGVRTRLESGDFLFGARCAVELAQRGDIVLSENSLGLCVGDRGAFLLEEGMFLTPFKRLQAAWKV